MARGKTTYGGKSKLYKNVYLEGNVGSDAVTFFGQIGSQRKHGFKTERECAKWVDLQLIRMGKDPVNILVKKHG